MSHDIAEILGPIGKLLDHLVEQPDVGERRRTFLIILSLVLPILQALSQAIVPKPSWRPVFTMGVYLATLLGGLAITGRLQLRRWLIYAIPPLLAAMLALLIYTYSFFTSDVHRLAPAVMTFGRSLPYTSAYGTNARVETRVYARGGQSGPDRFVRLKLDLFCQGSERHCNAGWMITNLQGLEDPSPRQYLVFQVRGAQGNEVIGLAMKDDLLTEMRIFDLGDFIPSGQGIDIEWRTAYVPLSEFIKIDFSALDVISFFVDAHYTSYRTIDVDIGDIHLE